MKTLVYSILVSDVRPVQENGLLRRSRFVSCVITQVHMTVCLFCFHKYPKKAFSVASTLAFFFEKKIIEKENTFFQVFGALAGAKGLP